MTTIINTPPQAEDSSDSGLGIVLGVIVALILIFLFFVYVLPTLRSDTTVKSDNLDINVTLPANSNTPPTTVNYRTY